MRRLLKELASGGEVKGDTTTLEDFSVLAKLKERTKDKWRNAEICKSKSETNSKFEAQNLKRRLILAGFPFSAAICSDFEFGFRI